MHHKSFIFFLFCLFFNTELICQNIQLRINGSTTTETQIIDRLNYIKNHKDLKSVELEIDSLRNKLYKIGFIENELVKKKQLNDSAFKTTLALKNKYNTIIIYYNKSTISDAIIKSFSKNINSNYFEINFSNLENTLNDINQKQTESGFPFSELQLKNIRVKNNKTLEAELTTHKQHQKRIINSIIIKGYENFPKSFLKHFLRIKPNQNFNLTSIKQKTEQLQHLPFAKETKSPEVLFNENTTTLYLYLEKTKSNAFDGFLGFGSNDDNSKIEFDGYVNLNLNNNLNYGETLKLQYKSDENEQKTFSVNASLPYLFSSPVGLDVALNIFKKDSSFTNVNQSAKLHYQINPNHRIYTGINHIQSNNLLSENTTAFLDYKTNYFNLSYHYTKYQSQHLLFPINTNFHMESNFGNRTQNHTKEKQTLLLLETFKILNINSQNSFFIKLSSNLLHSNSYLENELLRFGGINSIRGFEENSIDASLFNVLNTEYRYLLSQNIYLHSIIDFAYYENKLTNTQEKLYGFGFGLGIITKAGLLKLNYANGKSENITFKFNDSKLHLSLSAFF